MQIKVTQNEVKINKDILNDGEYNIHKCQFNFDEEYNGLVQKAVFTLNDGNSYLETIVNNECNIPIEVLEEGVLKIGVYAYETNNDELVLRYSPSPDIIHVFDGSYVKDAQNSEGGTPTEYEQLESRVNTALNEIDEALDDVETAVNEANNLDIDVSKTGKVATIDVTKKNDTVKTVTLSDGTSLQFNWEGTSLGIKTDNEESYTYVDLEGPQGKQGIQGPQGEEGKTGPQGETGATGNGILSIQKTATVGLVDTYTITFTDGTTTTFDVTNGEDGEVTQAQLDETNENVSWLQTLTEQMPHVAGQGTDLSLESVLNYRLMKFLPQGVSKQESTDGKNKLDFDNLFGNANILTKNADGSYTATGDGTNKGITVDVNIPAGNYYLSVDYVAKSNVTTSGDGNLLAMNIFYDDNTSSWGALILSTSTVGTRLSFKISETNKSIKRIYLGQFSRFTGGTLTFKNVQIGTDDTYEPYTGGIPAPNPSYPFMPSRVTGENSLIISNENLFDKNDVVNASLNADGTTSSSTTLLTSDFIKIDSSLTYYKTTTGSARVKLYDENKAAINTTNAGDIANFSGAKSFTIPYENAKYIRFSMTSENLNSIMLVEGSTAPSTYIPHEEQTYPISLGNIELNSSPDGTIRDAIMGSSDVSYNLFDLNQFLSNAGIGTDGKIISATQNNLYYIPVKYGQNYKMSFTNTSATGNTLYGFCDELPSIDGNCTYNVVTIANLNGYVFTPTSATNKYLCIRLNRDNQLAYLSNIQITEGSEAKPYFPYGQVGMWYKREYIGKVVLNGQESWNTSGISNVFYIATITNYATTNNVPFATYYKGVSNVTGASNMGIQANNTVAFINKDGATTPRFYIHDTTFSTPAELKTWLSTHNTTVYYVLATPQDVQITDTTLINQLNDIYNNAHSYNGVTNITTTYEDGNEQMYLDIEVLKNVWEVTE